MTVDIENIGEMQALVDPGAQRSVLHARKIVQGDILPWNCGPLRRLGGEAYLMTAVNFSVKTEVWVKRMQHVPGLEVLPAKLTLESDFLLPKEYSIPIFVKDGSMSMRPRVPTTPLPEIKILPN